MLGCLGVRFAPSAQPSAAQQRGVDNRGPLKRCCVVVTVLCCHKKGCGSARMNTRDLQKPDLDADGDSGSAAHTHDNDDNSEPCVAAGVLVLTCWEGARAAAKSRTG